MTKRVELITQAEYAKRRGCSQVSVHRAVAAGRISLIGEKIDPAVADLQWQQNTRARARNASSTTAAPAKKGAAGGQTVLLDRGYADARTRREVAEAQLAEIEVATARREMVLRADVDRGIFDIGRTVRDRLTSCASRIASAVAPLSTAEACYEVVIEEHRAALEQMVEGFRRLLGESPPPGGNAA